MFHNKLHLHVNYILIIISVGKVLHLDETQTYVLSEDGKRSLNNFTIFIWGHKTIL